MGYHKHFIRQKQDKNETFSSKTKRILWDTPKTGITNDDNTLITWWLKLCASEIATTGTRNPHIECSHFICNKYSTVILLMSAQQNRKRLMSGIESIWTSIRSNHYWLDHTFLYHYIFCGLASATEFIKFSVTKTTVSPTYHIHRLFVHTFVQFTQLYCTNSIQPYSVWPSLFVTETVSHHAILNTKENFRHEYVAWKVSVMERF